MWGSSFRDLQKVSYYMLLRWVMFMKSDLGFLASYRFLELPCGTNFGIKPCFIDNNNAKSIYIPTNKIILTMFGIFYGRKPLIEKDLYQKRDKIIESIERNFGIDYGERPRIVVGGPSLVKEYLSMLIPRGSREYKDWNDFIKRETKKIYKIGEALYDGINHQVIVFESLTKERGSYQYLVLSHEISHGLRYKKNPRLTTKEMMKSIEKAENEDMKLLATINNLPRTTLSEGVAQYVSIYICMDTYDYGLELIENALRHGYILESRYENALRYLDQTIEIRDKLQAGNELSDSDRKICRRGVGKSVQNPLGYRLVADTVDKLGPKCLETLITNPPETLEELRNPDIYAARINKIFSSNKLLL
jgi:hypothetical protein